MKAIDTNIVLRVITADDPDQTPAARRLVETHSAYLTLTVLMEVEWVLRSAYRWPPNIVANAIFGFVSLQTVQCEDLTGTLWALDRYLKGADFADMIHVWAARECEAFVSFDRRLPAQAGPDSPVPIEMLA